MFAQLHESRQLVHQMAAGLSRDQLQFRPAPGRWTVAENLEHLAIVEDRIRGGLIQTLEQPPDPNKTASVTDAFIFENLGRVVQPLVAPEPVCPKSQWPLAELLPRFDAARQRTLDFAATAAEKDLRRHFMHHLFFGELDCYQWLVLTAGHTKRHCNQCAVVKACPDYPR